ncbi:AhpC-TSA-domain-containing protein [Heliocybe sulcata]|uniref:thioredoxin-dependent peroxiredoxin n=1 Tax=Heliocybe sulcata TaxID=5364 RepID=A0A5C3MZY9_9AGAM|nr:AhpC-TSA-domain-containing protein [Heliocybe sulcata]
MPRKAGTADEGAAGQLAPRRSTRLTAALAAVGASVEPGNVKRPREIEETDEVTDAGSKKAKSTGRKTKEPKEDASDTPAPTLSPIDVGDSLPSFVLKNEQDEDVDVATLSAEKGVVIFLVPKADTPGCTNQACGFRDSYPDFTSAGFDVYCLSADKPAAQNKWKTKKELQYPLLSDPKRVLITALGAGEGGKTKRSHFIFEKGGKLVDKKVPVKPVDSPRFAYEFIKTLPTV